MSPKPDTLTNQLRSLSYEMTADQRTDILDAVGLVDRYCVVATPLGPATVAFNKHGVSLLADTADPDRFRRQFAERYERALKPAARAPKGLTTALRTGTGRTIETDLRSLSEFQRSVLGAARDIPVGEVRPYQWIAERIGRPNAARAVGTALGSNPVPLVIPCHRIIRGDGATGDYIFGADRKVALLRREGANLEDVATLNSRGVHYVGSSTTRVFCNPSCHQARRITDRHKILLHTAAEAQAQRLRPCRSCQPVPVPA